MASLPSSSAPVADAPRPDEPPPATAASRKPVDRGRAVVPVGAVALLGLLAGWGLGRRSFWVDEAISAGATHELVATWKGTGGTMALYYALLTPWSWVSMDRTWLRALSVLFALAAVPVVWAAAQRAFDRRVATLATVFTASSWLVVRYAQEARSYSLVLLLTSVSWLALLAAVRAEDEAERTRWWRLYAAVAIISPLAHGLAILQLVGQVAFLWVGPDRSRWMRRVRPVLFGSLAVMAVLVATGASDVASWIPPVSIHQLGDLLGAFTGPGLCSRLVLGGATLLGLAVCAQRIGAATDPTERWMCFVPIMWGLVPLGLLVVGSFARPYLLARYVVGSAPGIALLLALAVLGARPKVALLRAGAVLIPVVAFLAVNQVELHRDRGDGWNAAASEIAHDAQAGDAIVFPNPSARGAFDYAWQDEGGDRAPSGPAASVPTAISPVEPLGDLRRFYRIQDPDQLTAAVAQSDGRRVWVVDQDGIGFDDTLTPFLHDATISRTFTVAHRTDLPGHVTVVLLERR